MNATLSHPTIRSVVATRYVTPLREGGSLPAIMEADDDGLYVVKFRGAGQGPKSLIAEVIAGEIGRALGLRVPELVVIDVDEALSKAEPDQEIQELLRKSAGLNIGVDFLPGSLAYNPRPDASVDPDFAADVVWFDAFTMNVDRTPRNPNMLIWHGNPWLIDHGASIYVQHISDAFAERAGAPFPQSADHVLLPWASSIEAAGERLAGMVTPDLLQQIIALLPSDLIGDGSPDDVERISKAYLTLFTDRLALRSQFEQEAERARTRAV
jgi:hypothetical protein